MALACRSLTLWSAGLYFGSLAAGQVPEYKDLSLADSLEYPALYTDRSETSTFNVEVMRGLALDSHRDELYAINTYASSLLRFDLDQLSGAASGVTLEPQAIWPTLVDPVAVATSGDDVYVLGQGSHALVRHDRVTGQMMDVFAPDAFSEPADLVIDEVKREAYVSCMGSDCVVRIRLGPSGSGAPMEEIERWSTAIVGPTDFLMKRPRFLSWTGEDLFVAPFLAGNNTMTIGTTPLPNQGGEHSWDAAVLDGGTIYDGYEPGSPVTSGLPDVDLVRIRPGAPGQAVIEPTFRDAGSLMTAHGQNVVDGRYWMLGIDGLNVQYDASGEPLLTEAKLRGDFARNTLVTSALPAQGSGPKRVTGDVLDLDDMSGQENYLPGRSLPFPYALEFGGPGELAAVASSTLSRVRLMNAAGESVAMIPPAPGSVHTGETVRDLLFRGDDLFLFCQGTSNILVWSVAGGVPAPSHRAELNLMSDPTPESIRQGRSAFYDAHRSANWRFTCATCHPGGESDLLAWHLKDGVHDFKDQTVTQPLKGLRETFPYHWRGERDLEGFEGSFRSILGSSRSLSTQVDATGSTELGDFQEFLFALRPAANPLEDLDRTPPLTASVPGLPSGTQPAIDPVGDVAVGLDLYVNKVKVCAQCHALPTGSVGSFHNDNTLTHERLIASNQNLETIQLTNFLQARDQPMVRVEVPDPDPASSGTIEVDRPLLGFGFQHTGAFTSIFHFMHARFGQALTGHIANATDADRIRGARDMVSFLRTLDTGTPPAAHRAVRLNRVAPIAARQEIRHELVRQAELGWIDLVVHGVGHGGSPISWVYEPVTRRFLPDSVGASSPGAQPLSYFFDFAQTPGMHHVFLGVLRGHGERLGVDFDRDGILNGDESPLHRWNRDRDGDGHPDGYERDHGGTEGDPSQGPVDRQAPSLVQNPATGLDDFELLMARASHAEFAFRADEEVRWELEVASLADPQASVPTVRSQGVAFARTHTIHVHHLRSSERSGELSSYRVTLTLIDRAGLRRSYELGKDITTSIDRGRTVSPTGNSVRVVVNQVAISDESYDPGTRTFQARVRIQVGNLQEIARSGLPGRAVIVQLLHRSALHGDWLRFDPSAVAHTGPNSSNLALPHVFGGAPYPTAPDGPLVLLGATDSSGEVEAHFTLSGLGPAEQIALNVVAIPPVADNQNPDLADPSFPSTSFTDWVMPATAADLRLKRIR